MASPEEYAGWIVQNQDKRGTPEFETVAQAYQLSKQQRQPQLGEWGVPTSLGSFGESDNRTTAEQIAQSPVTRFAVGAASPVFVASQALDKGMKAVLPEKAYEFFRPELASNSRLDQMSKGPGIAGAVGEMMNPVGLAAGKALPFSGKLAERLMSGAKLGATYGATTPVSDPDNFVAQKSGQIASGAAVGAAIPAVMGGVSGAGRAVRNAVDPWLPGGAERVSGRIANAAAGDKREQIIQLLRDNKQIVPGSQGSAGEVAAPAGSAEFAGLQRIAESVRPTPYDELAGARKAARVAAVRGVGQDKAALDAAVANRSTNAATNYQNAYSQALRADPELAQLSKNPFFQSALPDALRLAEANGVNPKTDMTHFLHYVKLSLDKQLTKTGDTALSRTEQEAVQGIKQQVMGWLEKKNPAYAQARSQFSADSRPINQMQVGQYLENKLTAPISDMGAESAQRATVYAQALRDAPGTLKRSTDFKRFDDLSQVLKPEQVQAVTAVGRDLGRGAEYERLGRLGKQRAQEVIEQLLPTAPAAGMFNPSYSVARAAFNRLVGSASKEALEALAVKMQNPQEMAKLMSLSPEYRVRVIEQLLNKSAVAAGSVSVAN